MLFHLDTSPFISRKNLKKEFFVPIQIVLCSKSKTHLNG